jgi:hypothetical protein
MAVKAFFIFLFTLPLTLSILAKTVDVVQAQTDPKYILGPLQAQRDANANAVVLCEASSAQLREKIAELESRLKKAEGEAPGKD